MEFGEKTIDSQTIYEGSLVTLEKQVVELQNGQKANRELIHHKPAVGIMAVDDQERMIFVRQYRKAVDRAIVEIPAGLVEAEEDWLAAAQREFNEETGFQAERWNKADGFYVSPGYLDEYLQMYWAEGISRADHQLAQDPDEHIEVLNLTMSEARNLLKSGEICDMKTIYALQYWQLQKSGE